MERRYEIKIQKRASNTVRHTLIQNLHYEQYSTLIQDYKYSNIIILFIDINQYLYVICSIVYNKY